MDGSVGSSQATTWVSRRHSQPAVNWCIITDALLHRAERNGSIEDLKTTIMLANQALKLAPLNHPTRGFLLFNLGTALKRKFDYAGSIADLNAAIQMYRDAVKYIATTHNLVVLNNLGGALSTRFDYTGSRNDLNEAIAVMEDVLKLNSGHDNLIAILNNLAATLLKRYLSAGSTDDLTAAIAMLGKANALGSEGSVTQSRLVQNLSVALISRFERNGCINDLTEAIRLLTQITDLIPDGDPYRSELLNCLGKALFNQFESMSSIDDLTAAVRAYDKAIKSAPIFKPVRWTALVNMGGALLDQFHRTRIKDYLNRSIIAQREALSTMPKTCSHKPAALNNLSDAFQIRFREYKCMNDLDSAIKSSKEAIEAIPVYHPNRALCLDTLGAALQRRFLAKGLVEDINDSVSIAEEAVAVTSDSHPDLAGRLNNLGNALRLQFRLSNKKRTKDRAIEAYEKASYMVIAPSFVRIGAAFFGSRLLIGHSLHRANSLLRMALELLPTLTSRHMPIGDRHYNISQFAQLPPLAVSVSLALGEPPGIALQLLERGRGILASLQLEMRSDISGLEDSHPHIAKTLGQICSDLDRPLNNPSDSNYLGIDPELKHRRCLITKLETLLKDIRNKPGFERFWLGPSESAMKSLAQFGQLIVFNVSEMRSDAFIVDQNVIRSIVLPQLTLSELEKYAKSFYDAVTAGSRFHLKARSEIAKVLEWLWDVAVGPVLDELGFTQPPSPTGSWPRVWWVGSGLLNLFPIHAAGYHGQGSTQNALDRVVSSYTPTLRSLMYARENMATASRVKPQKAMLVGMLRTPGQTNLPHVQEEIEELRKLLSPHVEIKAIDDPTKARILSTLQDYHIVHLACHGFSAIEPSQSKLLLHDWESSPLTVSDFTSLRLRTSHFAYLSACHTATTKDVRLLDESIHLAAAIQLAGFASVIGTLWNIEDQSAANVSKNVYASMLTSGNLDAKQSAQGLHRAIRALKESTRILPDFARTAPDDPLIWAPYVHFGV